MNAVARTLQHDRLITGWRPFGAQWLTPQAAKVLDHMIVTGTITNIEAHAVLQVRSVSRRITELRNAGLDITVEHKRDSQGQRYARYSL